MSDHSENAIQEVKYSLRALLEEVEQERGSSQFSRQAVDQEEIGKIFTAKKRIVKKRARRR